MADGTRLRTIENQLQQLTDTINNQIQGQLTHLTETVSNHSHSITDTASILQRMESVLQSLADNAVTHGAQRAPPPLPSRNIKLEFPRFDGSHALEWLFRANQFFDYYNTADPERLTIASVHFDQTVIPWFQMLHRARPFLSWQELSRSIELEFGPSEFERPRASLFKLTQTGSLDDYYLEFTSLANRSTGLTAEALLDCFISGLHTELQREVISQTPSTLVQAVAIARLYEDKFNPVPKPSQFHHPRNKNFTPNPSTNPSPTKKPPLLPTPNIKPQNQPQRTIKHISPAEMQLRREKGLCYYCDDKFSHQHRCPNKHLMLLQLDDVEDLDPDPDPINTTIDILEPTVDQVNHHLSLNAMDGFSSLGTLRFQGFVHGQPIQVLIDGGSTDNFFQPRLAKFLKLPVEPSPNFNVLVGNGNKLVAEGKVSELTVSIQGFDLTVPVFLLPFAGADLILGSSWLATLGPHVADYGALSLKFFVAGKFITLHGQNMPSPGHAQLHHLSRLH
ncbi:hypothetical protein A2U01_0008493, partial [Trifolium medium]|nr:hypothetical protein [Trifolium medium]